MLKYLFRFFQDPYSAIFSGCWPLIRLIYRPHFMRLGSASIAARTRIIGANHIWIGDNTTIGHSCLLHANPVYSLPETPVLRIGENCSIQAYARILAQQHVEIQDSVLFAWNIFIADFTHGYQDLTLPIMSQPEYAVGPVVLETGCWIGEGVRILGNVRIGCNSVVGANSVLKNIDVPAHSVVAGSPARIVRRFDSDTKQWLRIRVEN